MKTYRFFSTEKNLANNKIICYTYDSLSRLIKREVKNSDDEILSAQNFAYDAAGNIISAPTGTFSYDTQNKLTTFNGESVEYDLDGNMLTMPVQDIPEEYAHVFYDSSNRLLNAMGSTYTYDAENNRIRVVNPYFEQDFVYNTNCKLSQVLASFEFGNPIFYIYGLGLIGEEQNGQFYTYHYDYRGSTLAMTDQSGNIVVTAEYDVYGKMLSADGDRRVLFGYNGRDGVQSDTNGLLYMRARYYCPDRRRFVNADIIQGDINDSTSLNRYAYVNGNPVSLVDPFGLSAERGPSPLEAAYMAEQVYDAFKHYNKYNNLKYYYPATIGDWYLQDDQVLYDEDGLFAVVYKRYNTDGTIDYTIVNKGTTTTSDWINNLTQPFGKSSDMANSIKFAEDFVSEHSDSHITFVGHSKGGGEALANAKATNRDAIVFNPAIPNYKAYGLDDKQYTANAKSYVIAGEMLSDAYIAMEAMRRQGDGSFVSFFH